MLRRVALALRPLGAISAIVLATALMAPPAFASQGDKGDHGGGRIEKQDHDDGLESQADTGTCNGRQEFVRTEQKVCAANPHEPPVIVTRTCCMNPAGKVHCRPFRQCPNRSPS